MANDKMSASQSEARCAHTSSSSNPKTKASSTVSSRARMQRVVPSKMTPPGDTGNEPKVKRKVKPKTEVAPKTSGAKDCSNKDNSNEKKSEPKDIEHGAEEEQSITLCVTPSSPAEYDSLVSDVEAQQHPEPEDCSEGVSQGSASKGAGAKEPIVVPAEIVLDASELRRNARLHEIFRKIEEGKEERRKRKEALEAAAAEKEKRRQGLLREAEDEEEKPKLWLRCLKFTIAIIVIGSIFAIIYDTLQHKWIQSFLERTLRWIETNPNAGFFPIVGVIFLGTVFFVPSEFMCLGCGYIYAQSSSYGTGLGIFHAVVAVAVGGFLGAVCCFHLSRFAMRQWIEKNFVKEENPFIYAFDRVLQTRKSIVAVICFRLSLILPATALNYLAGASSMSVRHFCIASVGILPSIILYVALGATFSTGWESGESRINASMLSLIELVEGVLAVVVGGLYIYYQVRLERRIVESENLQTFTSFMAVPNEKEGPDDSDNSKEPRGYGHDEIVETPGYDEPQGPATFLEESGTSWSTSSLIEPATSPVVTPPPSVSNVINTATLTPTTQESSKGDNLLTGFKRDFAKVSPKAQTLRYSNRSWTEPDPPLPI